MTDFVNRTHELQALSELPTDRFQLALVWGRRRVGKTRLIDQFLNGRSAIVYQADEGTPQEQLRRFTDRIVAYRQDDQLSAQPLNSWDAAIAVIERLARDAKAAAETLFIVLDEFPRLVIASPRLPSLMQDLIETARRENLPLFLIIAGSQISLYEEHVLHGPLYGRRTWGEQLPPLGYREAGEFFPEWANEDKLRGWAVLGGIPYYLEQFSPTKSLDWNITNRLLAKGAVLYDEAELMIKEELGSDAATYQSIIGAVAEGATKQGEIASKVGIESSSASKYLNQLARLHVLEHRNPMGPAGKRGIWHISDHYLRAWFAFVRANRTDLEARRAAFVFRDRVRPTLDAFVSKPAFEDAIRAHAADAIGVDPAFPARCEIGEWWGPIPDDRYPGQRRTREGQLDVVGYDGSVLVLAGEAKWSSALEDGDALGQLMATVVHVPGYDPKRTKLAIYTRSGLTPLFAKSAANKGLIIRSVDDMYSS